MKVEFVLTDKQVKEIVIGDKNEKGDRLCVFPIPREQRFEPKIGSLKDVQSILTDVCVYLGTLGMDDALDKIYELVEDISNEILKVDPQVAKYE